MTTVAPQHVNSTSSLQNTRATTVCRRSNANPVDTELCPKVVKHPVYIYHKIGHNYFLPHSFLFITQLSVNQSIFALLRTRLKKQLNNTNGVKENFVGRPFVLNIVTIAFHSIRLVTCTLSSAGPVPKRTLESNNTQIQLLYSYKRTI